MGDLLADFVAAMPRFLLHGDLLAAYFIAVIVITRDGNIMRRAGHGYLQLRQEESAFVPPRQFASTIIRLPRLRRAIYRSTYKRLTNTLRFGRPAIAAAEINESPILR